MDHYSRIGMDTSKHVYQLHGVDPSERPVLRRKLRRSALLPFFKGIAPTTIGIEACAGSHHLARELEALGHTVKLMAPQLVKPYVKRGKNDAADAEALCEAMSRPTMRFVPIKTPDQQAGLMLVGMRDALIRHRTQMSNAIRGYAAEFGLVAATGLDKIEPLLDRIAGELSLPTLARELFALHAKAYGALHQQIQEIDAKLMVWFKQNAVARRLAKIPGVGPIGASLLVMKTPDPGVFRCGRDYAAWIGLTPRDHSTAGKTRTGVITRAGDEVLRSTLVVGATAVVTQVRRRREAPSKGQKEAPPPQAAVAGAGVPTPRETWLIQLLKRKSPKLVAVALANKTARIAWTMMVTGSTYDARHKRTIAPTSTRDAGLPEAA